MNTERLRELLGAATPGEWVASKGAWGDDGCVGIKGSDKIDEVAVSGVADAMLIAELRNNAEALLARLESAERVVAWAHVRKRDGFIRGFTTDYPTEVMLVCAESDGDEYRPVSYALAAHDKDSR